MNNRFKFRAWDKITQKIYSVSEIGYNNSKIDYMQLEIPDSDFNITGLYNRFVLMQCTGLKDKNGKLIYEGDIITRPNDKYTCNYEVIYDDDIFAYGLKTESGKSGTLVMLQRVIDEFEIIGNIYETPELLEGK